ncbi:cobyric acid synthase CobQ [Enterovibrio norvegicus FF-33]|uniref:Cobyric acid synthase n=1 Tax=Enterovibrio norvegicus FF-454 TaxID=1185651 RepID=A0A1E5CBQ0_9GAMM|nr:cobyric acid synthase [Enterovibrio norvegicus]OEE62936.1 cobyric acid synthase CobQ [Enterovibrio norvegicus FF-454]OEE66860.1 cobyric acid synthase CobQ [Enterovibrio norvegicus FF-33]OEE74918.1 cobyric acid synthase CobQ [Enterovibrio norvegicus FF-162]
MLPTSKALMVQGTTSDAGKSVLVAGLGRVLLRRGIAVAPFKPQNMALNSAVTSDGGEIGRAQAFQALACGVEPTVHMNPILLKPNSDCGAQIIVQGKAGESMNAIGFKSYKQFAMKPVMESFSILQQQFECVLIEGAGSPAEVNLRENDIANMGFAEEADVPVIIVADIDRGGVFAHLVGTLDCLSQSERDRVIGFVINRFRGDISLLEPGLDWLEEKTGKPVIGVVPYLQGLMLDAEDAIDVTQVTLDTDKTLNVVVPVVPRISNHTDFDALRIHPQVNLQFAAPGKPLPTCDLIILPGSKSVISDLASLREYGWDEQITKHLRYGGKVMGICGGYQMLGKMLEDPHGIEGTILRAEGLGYLNTHTIIEREKVLTRCKGQLRLCGKTAPVFGYEIHMGITDSAGEHLISSENGLDGLINQDNNVLGTYWHGLFDSPEACSLLLEWAGLGDAKRVSLEDERERSLNVLADALETSLDLEKLWPTR